MCKSPIGLKHEFPAKKSTMIKALIIEDEPKAANMLQIMLERNQPDVTILEKCLNLPAGVKGIKKLKPDLVFLDIEMPGHSGLQLLDFFNEEEVDFQIIFTTAFNDYAIRAFELSAIDYILKPIQIDKLNAAIDKFRRKKQKDLATYEKLQLLTQNLNKGNRRIAIPISSGIEIVRLDDILYFQADGSYTKIFQVNAPPIMVSKNLKYFEDHVGEAESFFRCHRSFLINTSYIKKVLKSDGGMLQLTTGDTLPITTERIDTLIELLAP